MNLVVLAAHLVTNGQAGFSTLKPLLLLQLLLLVVFVVLGVTAGPWRSAPNPSTATVTGMFGVAAMAVQNALMKISLKGVPSTTVMTTNVTQFMLDFGAVLTKSDPANIAQARDRAQSSGFFYSKRVPIRFSTTPCSDVLNDLSKEGLVNLIRHIAHVWREQDI
jgi:uncharacterized membrane protein YoaK (UPF0700 family)